MSEARIRASIAAFLAAWNERDRMKRAELLEHSCADDVVMHTSGRRLNGRDKLDAMMADFQRRRPGDRAVLVGAVDVQGLLFRYAGLVETAAKEPAGEAFDAGACGEDGRIRLLLTFIGAALPGGGVTLSAGAPRSPSRPFPGPADSGR